MSGSDIRADTLPSPSELLLELESPSTSSETSSSSSSVSAMLAPSSLRVDFLDKVGRASSACFCASLAAVYTDEAAESRVEDIDCMNGSSSLGWGTF